MQRTRRGRQALSVYILNSFIHQLNNIDLKGNSRPNNNFNKMEVTEIQQSPRIAKISKSTFQFKQLIDSLRRNIKTNQPPKQQSQHIDPHKDISINEESTVIASQRKADSQSNNFILYNQSEGTLKPKAKIQVGDRDKLKKRQSPFESNPQLQRNASKAINENKMDVSIQIAQQKSKDFIASEYTSRRNVSTQYQLENLQIEIYPTQSPRVDGKIGQIIKQNVKVQEIFEQKQYNQQKIRNISDNIVIEYCQNQKKLTQKSTPTQIFSFFANLCLSCKIVIKSPHIKKYKNCIYFGFSIEKDITYEGFLYFYDGKIYYGQFFNGFKHGLGVQINFNQNIKMKGQFKEGHKTGKFYIEKPTQKFIGYLENGLYQGEGRLTTQDYVYEGLFDRGQKNGYGQQYYPKTGVRITGTFQNGVLQKQKKSKSIQEISNRSKLNPSKDKQKQRLQVIRKKSLQKHNQRMNNIRDRNKRQSQYEIQFDAAEEYSDPPKIQFNANKLQVYRQPHKLPKICQQFEYPFETGNQLDSINSQNMNLREKIYPPIKYKKSNQASFVGQRMGTNQFEQPLPTPCLTVLRSRR